MSETCQRDLPSEPITEAWLKANGWRQSSDDNRYFMFDVDGEFDLFCVTLSAIDLTDKYMLMLGDDNEHLRNVTHTWQLIRLIEGLTGKAWT